jgi:hypothetical protein
VPLDLQVFHNSIQNPWINLGPSAGGLYLFG